jgi:hypothetical protein
MTVQITRTLRKMKYIFENICILLVNPEQCKVELGMAFLALRIYVCDIVLSCDTV